MQDCSHHFPQCLDIFRSHMHRLECLFCVSEEFLIVDRVYFPVTTLVSVLVG